MSFGSKKTLKRAALVLSVASISSGVSAQEHEVNEDVSKKIAKLWTTSFAHRNIRPYV